MAEEARKASGIEKFDGTDFGSRSVAHNVEKEKTIADLMKALSSMYEKPSANNKVHLMKKLFILKMVEGTPVA